MGSFDGAELFEPRLYIFSTFSVKSKENVGWVCIVIMD